jgi:hypothetical protein
MLIMNRLAAAGALSATVAATAFAQAWPAKTVRIIVPFAPGGTADTLGRIVSMQLTESLGQSFVIENRGGAGGVIGADLVAKSAPPALEWVSVPAERRFVTKRLQECNCLQALEGGIDSSHVTFLHGGALKNDPLIVGSKGNEYNALDLMAQFDVVEFEGGLLIGARRNAAEDRY